MELRYRRRWEWLACVLVVIACLIILQEFSATQRLSLALYDWVQRQDASKPDPDVLVVAIDELSIRELGAWPWPRHYHAEALRKLAQFHPRAVALDVIFSEPSSKLGDDEALANALRALERICPVYLPLTLSSPLFPGREPEELGPLAVLQSAASGLGHIHMALDADGVTRSLYLREGTERRMWNALSWDVVYGSQGPTSRPERTQSETSDGWRRESRRFLPFFPVGAHRSVPFVSILRGEVPEAAIRGKIVLIGATAVGLGDRYVTPLSAGSALTPGVEIHAAAADALKNGRMVSPVLPHVQLVTALIALVAWMCILAMLGPRSSLLGLFAFAILAISLSGILQLWWRQWLPVGSWLVAALLGYLLWSWRRLALLLSELYLRAERLHPIAVDRKRSCPPDGWHHIVRTLDESLEALQRATQQRNDALQLLSHDLRSPQSAILALLRASPSVTEEGRKLHSDIEYQVMTTLDLAEDFVAQLRAEGDVYDWQEVDLAQLLIEVYDRAWQAARSKGIEIGLSLPIEGEEAVECWAVVEPRLLRRAIFNLLENAVKYCPSGSRVGLRLECSPQGPVRFYVKDDGPGISADDQMRLFNRYARGSAADGPVHGHGLGLWFVRTVAERHGGAVTCASVFGKGSEFILTLPSTLMCQCADDHEPPPDDVRFDAITKIGKRADRQ